jgi:hypothetical protein
LFGAIAYNAENSKNTQGKSDLEFNVAQEVDQKEYADTYDNKGKVIICPPTFSVIKKMNNNSYYHKVEKEAEQ